MPAPRLTSSLALVTLLCACPKGDPSDTDSSDGSGDTTDTDGHGTTDPGADIPTTADPTGDDPATTGDTTTGDDPATTGVDPTGGADDDGCAAMCAKLAECGEGGAEGCSEWCPSSARSYEFLGDACGDLNTARNNCMAGLTCEELQQTPTPCAAVEDEIIGDTCTTATCRDLCDKINACSGGDPEDALFCHSECSFSVAEAFVDSGEACVAAIEALQNCELGLTCEQLDPFTGCEDEEAGVDAACG